MTERFPEPHSRPSLSEAEIESAVWLLLDQGISPDSKGNFLTALHRRGETAEELAGFAKVLLRDAVRPEIRRSGETPLLELCGTGGDRAGFLNISTASMFVAAGAGARVVKHGNRAVSSRSGSADVLESLGISLHLKPSLVGEVLERAGCVFLLAPDFHPTVAAVAPLRRSLAAQGQMTIFNLLGPLLNPAYPECQLTGINRPEMLSLYAKAMGLLGRHAAWAVHGEGLLDGGGVDELSITGPSRVVSVRGSDPDELEEFTISPADLGFEPVYTPERLLGGDALANASRISSILSDQEDGAALDMILLNAAAALHVAGMTSSLPEAVGLARESISSGRALRSLELLREASEAAAC